jgi:hypothetical protein
VVKLVVGIDVVTDHRHCGAGRYAGHSRQGDIQHVVAQASSVGPAAGQNLAVYGGAGATGYGFGQVEYILDRIAGADEKRNRSSLSVRDRCAL